MSMRSRVFLTALNVAIFSSAGHAASCKFEIKQDDQIESRRLVLFRGATVGLGGAFGFKDDLYYLRGFFGSNFKARATFTTDTPLELTLADGRRLTLRVATEAISSKIKFGHVITVSREAEPIYSVTPEQWTALRESPLVRLEMPFHVKGERQLESREVKSSHAQRISDALECVSQVIDKSSDATP